MTTDPIEAEVFETHEINLAAYLMESGLELQNSRLENTTVYFSFWDRIAADEYAHIYRYGDPQVSVRKFMAHLNHLRDLLRTHRGSGPLSTHRG